MKKLNRRNFFSSGCVLAGAAALASCTGNSRPAEDAKSPFTGAANSGPQAKDLTAGMSREQVMSLLDMKVDHYMQTTHHCAQSSFMALRDVFGLEDGAIVKALTVIPGIAEKGETCGAIVGPLMAFGLTFAPGPPGDRAAYDKALLPAGSFYDRMVEAEGSAACGDLLKSKLGQRFDLRTVEGLKGYRMVDGPAVCTAIVRNAVRIAAGIILDERQGPA
jgi:C_GCAxxG_C_C family probable redox protein